MRPAQRFLLFGLGIIVIMSGAACFGALWHVDNLNRAQLMKRLSSTSVIAEQLRASRLRELQLQTHALARDPAFVAYVAQSMIPDPRLGGAIDSASISDLLAARREGYDASVVLDSSGKPVTRSVLITGDDAEIQLRPLVQQTISSRKPTAGVWMIGDNLVWVAIDPLLRANVLQGLLLTATRIDDDFTAAISRGAQSGVALAVQRGSRSVLAASSDLDVDGSGLLRLNAEQLFSFSVDTAGGQAKDLRVEQEIVPAWVTPLSVDGGEAALVAMKSGDMSDPIVPAGATPLLLGVGFFAMIAALLVILQWSRTYVPLQDLGDVLRRSARGELFVTARNTGSGIVEHLRHSANELLKRQQK